MPTLVWLSLTALLYYRHVDELCGAGRSPANGVP